MKVVYIHRNEKAGHSIRRVFKTISENLNESVDYDNVHLPQFGSSPIKILKNLYFVYRMRDKKTIYHITGDVQYIILALFGLKTVLTIHDLVFLKNARNKIEFYIKKLFWVTLPVKIAAFTICISENTKNDILKYYSKKKLKVILNPISNEFNYHFKEFNLINPIILHIGTGWNKNLQNVISSLKEVNCHLRIIGFLNEEVRLLLAKNAVTYSSATNLSDQEIIAEYQKADIISFPSLYEGFGMPIIEGQTVGRPVLTSDIEPMLEVGDDSVCFVNPQEIDSMRAGFLKIINDKSYRENIVGKGLLNIKRFDAKSISDKYLEIYRQLDRSNLN
ncbi:glycosyltransferase [Chryseobacterium sp. Leaf394]|uniref:glycosyltransferase n=1 Tax=Chryseobacterium sp. Leaf394 TaxID=1736361 RepID=UPI0006FB6B81|nr:glycosyltransferase [Chryseobacterium sp. Leaf394]KQS93225.1 hypothetical protein ASG21_12635 [Chryseobacterium sp. Leaf394]